MNSKGKVMISPTTGRKSFRHSDPWPCCSFFFLKGELHLIQFDHHFSIGHSHKICQDFCASNPSMAALSDGCSIVVGLDGEKIEAYTDIGSRLIAMTAIKTMKLFGANFGIGEIPFTFLIQNARCDAVGLGLGEESLSATLLTIQDLGDYVRATICGDGLIAARSRLTGDWKISKYQFPMFPFYLRYLLGKDQLDQFIAQCSPNWNISISESGNRFDLCSQIQKDNFWKFENFDKKDFDTVIAISDGIFSFTSKTPAGECEPIEDRVIEKFLDFRRMKGRFVLRQLNGVLSELKQHGLENQDDISMIACHIPSEASNDPL